EGETCFIIKYMSSKESNKKIINEIFKKTELLIKNEKLRKQMSKNCVKEIKDGKFSVKKRNKRLKKIYEEALK
ncbi:MAG: hypothetical protein U9Q06_03380, partial [Nanoarchaeota archaeon]|nr:hypothetical protein [Nanoarchaeota archaeon]